MLEIPPSYVEDAVSFLHSAVTGKPVDAAQVDAAKTLLYYGRGQQSKQPKGKNAGKPPDDPEARRAADIAACLADQPIYEALKRAVAGAPLIGRASDVVAALKVFDPSISTSQRTIGADLARIANRWGEHTVQCNAGTYVISRRGASGAEGA